MIRKIWAEDIEDLTEKNKDFRRVLHVGKHSEVTLMSIPAGQEIGLEVHPDNDQFLCIEEGKARVVAGPAKDDLHEVVEVEDDWAFVVPAGTWHNVINIGRGALKLFTVYSPSNHKAGTVHKTKVEADAAEKAEHRR